jgi:hypothetical protein
MMPPNQQTSFTVRPRLTGTEVFLVIYLSFGTAQLFTNFVHYDVGKYLFADYARLFVLSVWWYLIVARRLVLNRRVFAVLGILAMILLIEVYHVERIGIGAGGVGGIKAILYNALYGSLINLVMFALVLHEYRTKRMVIIKYVVATASWLTLLHVITWLGVFLQILPVRGLASAVQVLNNNTVSYVGCFVLYCLHFTSLRHWFSGRAVWAQSLLAVATVLLNTTRGAILILVMYGLILAFRRASPPVRLGVAAMGAILLLYGIGSTRFDTVPTYVELFESAYSNIDMKPLSHLSPLGGFEPTQAELTGVESDAFLSAIGRIFANVMAYKLWLLNAALGVGTYTAYSIDAYDAGIHSLQFLYVVSSGVVGTVLLIILFGLLGVRRSAALQSHLLYLLPVGLFLNMFPMWYACCFFLDARDSSPAD